MYYFQGIDEDADPGLLQQRRLELERVVFRRAELLQ